jgi:propanol-preferring alcohol dehydrogenase
VANLTRRDGEEFLQQARAMHLQVAATAYPLARANDALDHLRAGSITGAAVLVP